jgi:hypothetical protein
MAKAARQDALRSARLSLHKIIAESERLRTTLERGGIDQRGAVSDRFHDAIVAHIQLLRTAGVGV